MTNKVIYIPEYVEQGVAKLQQAKSILSQIAAAINSGVSTVNASGYNRGIPHIEKGDNETSELTSLESTIDTITTEIQKYSNGEALELENAIIIADPATIEKYGLKKEDIDYTLSDYIFKNENVASNPTIQAKWKSGFLTAPAGYIKYTGADGRLTKETWCNLNPNNLAKLMREDHGIELDYWIREDGVYMYGDYVMVAADIPHMDGTQQEAEYRKGDLVQTSLGTGMVVDLCGMAESTRKGNTEVDVWYDIYTAWGAGGAYGHVAYCKNANCNDQSHTNPKSTMIRKAENPTTINPRTGKPINSGFVFKNNNTTDTTTQAKVDTTTQTTTTDTTKSQNTFTTNPDLTTTTTQTTTQTTNTFNNTGSYTGTTANTSPSYTSTPSSGKYTSGGSGTPSYVSNPSKGSYSSGNVYQSSGVTSSPSTSQVTNISDVNGFSKPVVSTPNQTPTQSTVVTTPTVSTPVTTPVTPPTVTNPTPSIPNGQVSSEQVMVPGVEVDNSDMIVTQPQPMPEVPDTDIIDEIINNESVKVENIPVTTPADTPIENNKSNNTIPILATVAATGALATGIGAKIILDKRKENQENGEDEEFFDEE